MSKSYRETDEHWNRLHNQTQFINQRILECIGNSFYAAPENEQRLGDYRNGVWQGWNFAFEYLKQHPEYLKEIGLFDVSEVKEFAAYNLYYSVNPKSTMCIPNVAYEQTDKMFEKWNEEYK